MKKKRTRKKKDKVRVQSSITLYPEDWEELDKIGPSRGKAVESILHKK